MTLESIVSLVVSTIYLVLMSILMNSKRFGKFYDNLKFPFRLVITFLGLLLFILSIIVILIAIFSSEVLAITFLTMMMLGVILLAAWMIAE